MQPAAGGNDCHLQFGGTPIPRSIAPIPERQIWPAGPHGNLVTVAQHQNPQAKGGEMAPVDAIDVKAAPWATPK